MRQQNGSESSTSWALSIPFFADKFLSCNPACAVAASLKFEAIETGIHRVKLRFGDADGREVLPTAEMQMNVVMPPDFPYLTINPIFNFQQLTLPRFGEYSVDLAIDGIHEGSLPLFVREQKPNLRPA
jgi:hypothetical protein